MKYEWSFLILEEKMQLQPLEMQFMHTLLQHPATYSHHNKNECMLKDLNVDVSRTMLYNIN